MAPRGQNALLTDPEAAFAGPLRSLAFPRFQGPVSRRALPRFQCLAVPLVDTTWCSSLELPYMARLSLVARTPQAALHLMVSMPAHIRPIKTYSVQGRQAHIQVLKAQRFQFPK